MEYLKSGENETVSFDKYFEFLESIKGNMPPHLQKYALDYDHYNLLSHSSLHDAWLVRLAVSEIASGMLRENRRVGLEAKFLGPYHDKILILRYLDVKRYMIRSSGVHTGHGDVLIHEFRESMERGFLHEVAFVGGSVIMIEFMDFEYEEKPFKQDTQ